MHWSALILASIFVGASILIAPEFAWIILGILVGIVLLGFPAHVWIIVAILITSFSRLFVATGFVPPLVNYFHFPLILGAAFTASARNSPSNSLTQITSSMRTGIIGLFVVSIVSWLINGGEFLRPLLTYLILMEPFLLIYALLKTPLKLQTTSRMWKLILFIAFLQMPLGLWQAFSQGFGDPVQGTFVGLGQGASAAGAIALIGALIIATRILLKEGHYPLAIGIIAIVALLLVPILSDAKYVLAAFLVGILLILVSKSLVRPARLIFIVLIVIFTITIAASYYPPLKMIWDPGTAKIIISRKFIPVQLFLEHSWYSPWAWLIGFGPGNTFSYVALQAEGGIGNPDSPIGRIGLSLTEITREAMNLSFRPEVGFATPYLVFVERTSAVWQIWSSWLGVWGDLGFLGLGFYFWIWLLLWRSLAKFPSWQTISARAILLMALLMGAIYRWLEEPNFMIVVALAVGLALVSSEEINKAQDTPGMYPTKIKG